MKTKILYVITKGNFGGAQRYVFDLATHFNEDCEVAVALGAGETLERKLAEKKVLTIKIPDLDRDVALVSDIKSFFFLVRLFLKERPNVVHLNSSKTGGLGALVGRIAGIQKIIFTVHGFAVNENRPWLEKKIITFLSWLTLFLATDVIFVCSPDKKQAEKWPLKNRKLHLIHNGIALPQFFTRDEARAKLIKEIGVPSSIFASKTVCVSIGELTKNKNHSLTLLALKENTEAALVIFGDGEEREKLQKEIAELGIQDRVYLAGFLQDASHYLKAFDIFLLSSIKEGLPYVILEAGAASLPVLSTNVGGISDIIENSTDGILVKPSDVKSYSQKLSALTQDQVRQKTLGDNLHQKIISQFTLEKMLRETKGIYL